MSTPSFPASPLGPAPADPLARPAARSWVSPVVSVGILAGAYVGCVRLFRVLDAMDNSPEAYVAYGGRVAGWALAAGVVAAGIACVILFALPARDSVSFERFRRAGNTVLVGLGAGVVLWWAPTPFGITRVLTFIVLAFAAARLAIASVMPARGTPTWMAPLAAVGAGVMAARVLLLMKLNGIGWAFAID